MKRDTIQIRIVTGEGLLNDQDFGCYQNLDDAGIAEVQKHFDLAAVGTLLEFVHPDALQILLQADEPTAAGPELVTCWKGQPLQPGTPYGVLLDAERVQHFARKSVQALLDQELKSDRFATAKGNGQFTAQAGRTVQAKPANVWKAKRNEMSAETQAQLLSRLAPPPPQRKG